jgi:hypothetical protein
MGEMNGNLDPTDSVRIFGHVPIRLDSKPIPGNVVPGAKLADDVGDATCHGPDKQFDGTHPGILPSILRRLIRHNAMITACDVVPHASMIGGRELHRSMLVMRQSSFVNYKKDKMTPGPAIVD